MSRFLSSCLNFFRQKRLISLLALLGIVTAGVCFGADASSGPQYTESDMTKAIIDIFDLIFGLLAMVLGPMVVLAGWLLSPDWTMGDFFGLRGYFREVWILVANIVYIIFALMLLYMAIMQIFGGAENEYAFKKKLGPFLVGILIVPFTWLIVSWTLSFANQAVAAVLSIPMGSISKLNTGATPGKQNKSLWHMKVLPTEFDFSDAQSGYGPSVKCDGGFIKGTTKRCISPAEFLTYNQAGPFFIIMIYAYNIFKIQEADITPLLNFCRGSAEGGNAEKYKSANSCVKDLMGLIRNYGLALIVTVFFAIMLIALCWVLLMRAIKLWIYIMLSPLFGLAYFTGKGFGESVGEAGESGFGSVGFKSFFQLAMVPVLVSAVLAFGLLFVGVVRDNFHGGDAKVVKEGEEFCTNDKIGYMVTYCITAHNSTQGMTYGSKLIIGTDTRKSGEDSRITLNFGDSFGKIISGAAGASVASGAGAVAGAIGSVDDIFAHLILTILALVFMFIGVKAAVQYDEVTRAAFAPFAKLGESAGNFVAHSPSYLPLPHPAFAALTNPAVIESAARMINNKITTDNANIGRSLNDMMGGKTGDFNKAVKNLESGAGSLNEVAQSLERMEYKNPKEVRKAILAALDHSPPSVQNDAVVKAFRAKIEADGNGSSLAHNIETSPDAVAKLEGNDRTKGIGRVGASLGAQATAAEQPFHNAKFESDGTIKIGLTGYGVTKDAAGKYIPNLNPEQKTLIKGILPNGFNMSNVDKTKTEDLFKKVFPELNVPNDKLDWTKKKEMLEALKTSAN